ncbi:hypothetical protein F2981_11265 [Sinorhizobium meliloti]|nr:hypothetical protein [Sinorhizobium meliloti]
MAEKGLVVGIDVAKGWWTSPFWKRERVFRVDNDSAGWALLLQRLRGRRVRAVGLEPSGGYERGAKQALRKAGLPVRMSTRTSCATCPRPRSLGQERRLDAVVIARYTADMPTREMRVDPLREQLAELVSARRQLTRTRSAFPISLTAA